MDKQAKQLPVDEINAGIGRLQRSGRDIAHAAWEQGWQGGEFGLCLTWPDGHAAFIGFGQMGTDIVEAHLGVKH